MKFLISKLTLLLMIMALSACSTIAPLQEKPDDPNFAPVPAQSLKPPPITNGSLFQHHYAISLYSDQRARRIGDIITIILQEQTNAKKSNSSSSSKASDVGMVPTDILGTAYPFLGATLTGDRTFKGKGNSGQSNSLNGNITVTISITRPSTKKLLKKNKFGRFYK